MPTATIVVPMSGAGSATTESWSFKDPTKYSFGPANRWPGSWDMLDPRDQKDPNTNDYDGIDDYPPVYHPIDLTKVSITNDGTNVTIKVTNATAGDYFNVTWFTNVAPTSTPTSVFYNVVEVLEGVPFVGTPTTLANPATAQARVEGNNNDVVSPAAGDHYSVEMGPWSGNRRTVTYTSECGYAFRDAAGNPTQTRIVTLTDLGYPTRTYQVDRYMWTTPALGKVARSLPTDRVLKYREDRPFWGRARYQFVTIRISSKATNAQVIRAINAQTKAAIGDVRTTAPRFWTGRRGGVTIAWQLGRGATVKYPWGKSRAVSQRFVARS